MKMLFVSLFAGLCLLGRVSAQDTFTLEIRLLKLHGDKPDSSALMQALDQSQALLATIDPLQLRAGETAVADDTEPKTLPPLSDGMKPRTVPVGLKVVATLRRVFDEHATVHINLDHSLLTDPEAPFPDHEKLLSTLRLSLGEWYFAQGTNRESGPESEQVYTALRLTKS